MSLALYGHPFSSYAQKALIALYENGTPFEFRCIGPETPQHSAEWLRRWPIAKFPLLVDGEHQLRLLDQQHLTLDARQPPLGDRGDHRRQSLRSELGRVRRDDRADLRAHDLR